MDKLSLIYLAGGKGERVGGHLPKQFLPLEGKPLALYALEQLTQHPFEQIVIVCDPLYREVFSSLPKPHSFASPGRTRQDSVLQGWRCLHPTDFVCIHDSARPFPPDLAPLIRHSKLCQAACFGLPLKFTVKQADRAGRVEKTLDRGSLYEIQTPQIMAYELLGKGLKKAHELGISVTDDIALAEILKHAAQIVAGSERNIKITTPGDFELARFFLSKERA